MSTNSGHSEPQSLNKNQDLGLENSNPGLNDTKYDIRLLKPLSECRAHTIKLQVKNN